VSKPNAFSGSSANGGGFGQAPAPAPVIPDKTPEQLEKERQAAALFGGIVPGAAPPPPVAAPRPVVTHTPRAMSAEVTPVAAPPVAAAPPAAAPPAAAPAVDLLDFGGFDAPAPAPAPASNVEDIFGAMTLEPTPITMPAPVEAPPLVETVSEEETAAPAPAPPVDPFAAEGLLGDFTETPLQGFGMSTSKFEYNGATMAPLKITTAQFGPQWGVCPATSPVSINSRKVKSLDSFMIECESVGLHPVEAIAATNEAICAGMVDGGSKNILVHGKISPLANGEAKIDITVKSTDSTLSGSLALYLQNMMK